MLSVAFSGCVAYKMLDVYVQLASLSEKHGKVVSRLSQLQEDVDKLRSLSDTLSGNYDKSTAEVSYSSLIALCLRRRQQQYL